MSMSKDDSFDVTLSVTGAFDKSCTFYSQSIRTGQRGSVEIILAIQQILHDQLKRYQKKIIDEKREE